MIFAPHPALEPEAIGGAGSVVMECVFHREAPKLDTLVAAGATLEMLADGFIWTEGPVWLSTEDCLLFSDVPANKMYRWSEADGISVFLDPSGFDGPDPSAFREPGSNGLIRGPGHTILMCDHGNRAVARLDLASKEKVLLATQFEGRRFNSPNDLVLASTGAIYFTDPPYGLEGLDTSPLKELAHNGVYRLDPDGKVSLMDKELTFPNGILLSPDERTLYVAVSDPDWPVWMAYDVGEQGELSNRRIFADSSESVAAGFPGLPDGMAIDVDGNLFATGPGGIHLFTREGERLGRIDTGKAVANCAFGGADGSTLYIASTDMIARLPTLTRGLGCQR